VWHVASRGMTGGSCAKSHPPSQVFLLAVAGLRPAYLKGWVEKKWHPLRFCGAQPRPVLHLRCARGGGRAPPRTTRAAFRTGVPTFSGSRGLGRGTPKDTRGAAQQRRLNISPPPSGFAPFFFKSQPPPSRYSKKKGGKKRIPSDFAHLLG
jgi:hypothetical protein